MTDKMKKKNPENHIVGYLMNFIFVSLSTSAVLSLLSPSHFFYLGFIPSSLFILIWPVGTAGGDTGLIMLCLE
jgi:hypothetical protein